MLKEYETDEEYVLEALEEVEDKLTDEIFKGINDEKILSKMCKFIAIRNSIEKINIKIALNKKNDEAI
ncbi:hypothetical protein [Clostridium sp. C2-6-12]|uniref:hypothetical protein n=1 Tax=Clostridium sp. C2-6-12 TaxID=2698832 RepID=UPI00136B7334|nr:hypothetical protein [Clostridium sp. C2-6-12]